MAVINPNNIRRVQVEFLDGRPTQELSQEDVFALMQSGKSEYGGSNVSQLADGVTAISGLFNWYRADRFRDDEYDARKDLASANQKMLDKLRQIPGVGMDLGTAFQKQCEAQEKLDRAQSLINRSEDMQIAVASGAAGAKALWGNGQSQSQYGGMSNEQILFGGAALWLGARSLTDGRDRRRSRDDDEDLGPSTVPK